MLIAQQPKLSALQLSLLYGAGGGGGAGGGAGGRRKKEEGGRRKEDVRYNKQNLTQGVRKNSKNWSVGLSYLFPLWEIPG